MCFRYFQKSKICLTKNKTSPRVFNIFENSFRILEGGSRRLKTLGADFCLLAEV